MNTGDDVLLTSLAARSLNVSERHVPDPLCPWMPYFLLVQDSLLRSSLLCSIFRDDMMSIPPANCSLQYRFGLLEACLHQLDRLAGELGDRGGRFLTVVMTIAAPSAIAARNF